MERHVEVTSKAIKELLTGHEEKSKMILEVFQQHNEQMAALLPNEYSASTLKRYKTSIDHTTAFIKWKYKARDLEIHKLNFEFVSQYEFWLKSVRKDAWGYSNNQTAILLTLFELHYHTFSFWKKTFISFIFLNMIGGILNPVLCS